VPEGVLLARSGSEGLQLAWLWRRVEERRMTKTELDELLDTIEMAAMKYE